MTDLWDSEPSSEDNKRPSGKVENSRTFRASRDLTDYLAQCSHLTEKETENQRKGRKMSVRWGRVNDSTLSQETKIKASVNEMVPCKT